MSGLTIKELDLRFKTPAGTSKGVLTTRKTWIVSYPGPRGLRLGEAGPLSWLSIASADEVRRDLSEWAAFDKQPLTRSGVFAPEMIARDVGDHILFPSAFTQGRDAVRINGLVWMGTREEVAQQVKSLLARGFRCIKLKVGADDWETELASIDVIRNADATVEIRVDANGAFSPMDAREKLSQLADRRVRSIEQPIAPGQWQELAKLCAESPIDIALDEELIRADDPEALVATVRPQGLVLKPSLLGGFAAAERWIELADRYGIYWWATSALESSIGLNALAQWLAVRSADTIHGLGTGSLYVENIGAPLRLEGELLTYDPEIPWNLTLLTG